MKFMKLDHLQGGGKPQSCQEFKLQKKNAELPPQSNWMKQFPRVLYLRVKRCYFKLYLSHLTQIDDISYFGKAISN